MYPTIPCESCKSDISPLAETCPGCGHPNGWIHPKIQHFLSIKDTAGTEGPFNYTYTKMRLNCKASGALPWWYWVGLAAMIFLLKASIPIAFIMGFVWTGIAFANRNNKILIIDFSNENPLLENNDSNFWRGLLEKLDIKTS